MSASSRNKDKLPLAAGLLATAAGMVLASNGASTLMTLVGVGLLMAGIVATIAVVAGQSGRAASPAVDAARELALSDGQNPAQRTNAPARRTEDGTVAGTGSGVSVIAQPSLRTGDWLTQCTGELVQSFNAWLEQQDADKDLWPAFDRWIRDALNQGLRARRVRCFRAADGPNRLVSLTNELEEPLWPAGTLPGLVEHVLATGRPYVKGDRNNGDLIEHLVSAWCLDPNRIASLDVIAPHWLLPVRHANRTIGLVLVGELPEAIIGDSTGLATAGALLSSFWRYIRQSEALAIAEQTDRTSGVLTRVDLTSRAEKAVAEACSEGEPVVLIALAVEGVRRLDDQGHWELRDQLMREIGNQMRRKLRSDDLVGRFSEDRFVAVLRRLDLALGEMISRKLLAAVEASIRQQPVLDETVRVRCGLTDAGPDGFEAAVGRAFHALHEARREDRLQPLALSRRDHEQLAVTGGPV